MADDLDAQVSRIEAEVVSRLRSAPVQDYPWVKVDVDRIVIDVLDAYQPDSRLHELLRARNVRSVEFWRGKS